MIITLVIQCVSTWDLMPVEDETRIYINDFLYPHTVKKGGYRIITKELPAKCFLSVRIKNYLPFETEFFSLPEDKILICEMIMREAPKNSVCVRLKPPAAVVLGYGYYRLAESASENQELIKIRNPSRINAEGKRFLLRDTKSETEEFIMLGDALDVSLSAYKTSRLKNCYSAEGTVLFPAFYAGGNKENKGDESDIPLRRPPSNETVWIYEDGIKRKININ